MRAVGAPRTTVVAGKFAQAVRPPRETVFFAAPENDVEGAEARVAKGETGRRFCEAEYIAAGTGGEIEFGTVCGADEDFGAG